jgi:hypothetical protein
VTSETRERIHHELTKRLGPNWTRHDVRQLTDQLVRKRIDRTPILATHCEHCGNELPDNRQTRQRFCTKACRQRHWSPHHKAAHLARKKAAK